MKRIDVVQKKCRGCRKWMARKVYNGVLEKPAQYAAREHCGKKCEGRARSWIQPRRRCLYDGVRLERKRRPGGRWETRRAFRSRRWCNAHCRKLWNEATWYEREAARAVDRKPCANCAANWARVRRATVLCFACAGSQRRTADRWISSIPELDGRSERQHRTNLRKECEHGRIKGACRPCRAVALDLIRARAEARLRREWNRFTKVSRLEAAA